MKFLWFAVFGAVLTSPAILAQAGSHRMSGVYPTSIDYQKGRLEFEGPCGTKLQKIEVHNVLNKPYIDLIRGTQEQRLFKNRLFGFHACDGGYYRFDANLEYRLLEAGEAYIYVRETHFGRYQSGRVSTYYFSVGSDGEIFSLTTNNLKQEFPNNSVFCDSLDVTINPRQRIEQYDEAHKMFKVNYLLKASHELEH